MRSTNKIWILAFASIFLFPAASVGQASTDGVGLEVSGLISKYSYKSDSKEWRTAVSGQGRLLVAKWVHLEAGMGKAWTRTLINCPGSGSCRSSVSSAIVSWHGAVGVQAPVRGWVPFLGFGTGHLSNDFEDSDTHVQYYGLQRQVNRWFSVMGEYRRTRFRWYDDHKVSNEEWGVGVVFRMF